MSNRNDSSEVVRRRLNRIDGKDAAGNDNRFMTQLKAFIVGAILESSSNTALRTGGRALRLGAEKSFADYVGLKVSQWVQSLFH